MPKSVILTTRSRNPLKDTKSQYTYMTAAQNKATKLVREGAYKEIFIRDTDTKAIISKVE